MSALYALQYITWRDDDAKENMGYDNPRPWVCVRVALGVTTYVWWISSLTMVTILGASHLDADD